MTAPRKRYLTAVAATAVLALGLYGCGGGGGGDGPMMPAPEPMPEDVDLSGVTAGFMAVAGMFTLTAGQSQVHGDIAFSCAAGGADCEVMVTVDASGNITATKTGGTVTAMNSAAYTARITPMAVDLARVTPGYMAEAGTVTVTAGQTAVHGDIEFSCAGAYDCEVVVMVDANGDITATKTGGTVTAMNAPGYPYRHGLGASPLASPTASSAADSLDRVAATGTAFGPLAAPVKFETDDMGQFGAVLLEEDGAALVESVTDDGQGGYSVVIVVNGQRTEVQFQQADFDDATDNYIKRVNNIDYYLWHFPIVEGDPLREVVRHYFTLFGFEGGQIRGFISYGVTTPSGKLTSLGTATYEGHVIGEIWDSFSGPDRQELFRYLWGELTLRADFSAGTVNGAVGRDGNIIWIQLPDKTWIQAPDTNSIMISNGEIDGNRFQAEWEGQDTDTTSTEEDNDSLLGFEGSLLGEFYGPDGEEVGGVFTGHREATNQAISGRLGGESKAATAARMAVQTAAGRDDGISVSQDPAVYADSSTDTLASLLPDGNTAFAPVSAVLQFQYEETEVPGEYAVSAVFHPGVGAVFVKSISSDGAQGFRVTYVIDGRESTIHFTADKWAEMQGSYINVKDRGRDYLYSHTDAFYRHPNDRTSGSSEFDYFDMMGWYLTPVGADDSQGYTTFGVQTRPENLPAGSGSYSGRMYADGWEGEDPDNQSGRVRLRGDLTLNADFDSSAISGQIDRLAARPNTPGEMYQALREGNAFDISNGVIANGQFSADWVGVDSNTTPGEYSAAGFEGTMVGQFYGPAAEEVGGSIAGQAPAVGSDPALYLAGIFGARSRAVQLAAGIDDGVSVSQDPAVYAESSSDSMSDLLPDGNTAFAPMSVAVQQDYDVSQAREPDTGAAFVKSISSDGANGFIVTYVVNGKESRADFAEETWFDCCHFEVIGAGLWSITDSTADPNNRTSGSSEFDYFDIMGWYVGTQGGNFEGTSTFGARTRPENLPAGNASYAGWVRANAQQGDDPNRSGRHRVNGTLTLNADFDSSSITGQIDGIETLPATQRYDDPWYQYAGGNTFDISNGVIADGRFEADWVGNDTNAGSALEDSVRGFEGTMVGEFYGPNAEEVGGVLGGHRDAAGNLPALYLHGAFGATRDDVVRPAGQ